jgi:general secretion pathway protein D
VIGQRKIEHEIRLKDGEVNLLGGMLEHQDTKSVSGIPGLSSIPILKYLFSETSTESKDNEIVFALVPHIVRKREQGDLSDKTLDVGTGTSINLRHTDKPVADSQISDTGK